jgi:hypothetical protein
MSSCIYSNKKYLRVEWDLEVGRLFSIGRSYQFHVGWTQILVKGLDCEI